MFDTNVTNVRSSSPSRIDVHEHRAPTDDSVRLLNEMQRAAEKQIINSIPLEDNLLKGQVFLEHYVPHNVYTLTAVYSVNGRSFETKVDRGAHQLREFDGQKAFLVELRDKMATDMASSLIDDNINPRIFADGLGGSW